MCYDGDVWDSAGTCCTTCPVVSAQNPVCLGRQELGWGQRRVAPSATDLSPVASRCGHCRETEDSSGMSRDGYVIPRAWDSLCREMVYGYDVTPTHVF